MHVLDRPIHDPRTYPVPRRLALRPRDPRGFVVPWFVAEVDGVFDFRVVEERKRQEAIRHRLCWICGQGLGRHKGFVIGPMCLINKTSSEPPAHLECALYSVAVCPFLARPHARRRENDLPDGAASPGGLAIKRNPGVAIVYVAADFEIVRTHASDGGGVVDGWILRMGDPISIAAFAEGRAATADELWSSIVSGYPSLADSARAQGGGSGPVLRLHVRHALVDLVARGLLNASHLARVDEDCPPVMEA